MGGGMIDKSNKALYMLYYYRDKKHPERLERRRERARKYMQKRRMDPEFRMNEYVQSVLRAQEKAKGGG
jgi:hypothetical protein